MPVFNTGKISGTTTAGVYADQLLGVLSFLTSGFLLLFSTWDSHLKFSLYILYIVIRNKE